MLQKNSHAASGPSAPALRLIRTATPRGRIPNASVIAAAAVVSLISLVPLGFIVWVTIQTGWHQVIALVFRNRVGELLVNTVLLEVCTLPLCIVLAVTLAWLTERTDLPGGRLWTWLAVSAGSLERPLVPRMRRRSTLTPLPFSFGM